MKKLLHSLEPTPLPVTGVVLCTVPEELHPECLASLAWCQEILLVAPQTLEHAWKKFKPGSIRARLVFHNQDPIIDFAEIRNFAIQHVTTPWTMMLDSDEVLEKQPHADITELLEIDVPGVSFQRQDIFFGKKLRGGEGGKHRFVRLFKTGAGTYHRAVHEVLVLQPDHFMATDWKILHYAHPSVTQFVASIARYAELEARLRVSTGKRPSMVKLWTQALFFPLGKALHNFFLRGGWRDGWHGFAYTIMMSLHSSAVRAYWYEHTRR
jgi:hypothetical protein